MPRTTAPSKARIAVLRSRYQAAGDVEIPDTRELDVLAEKLFGPDIPVTIIIAPDDDLVDLRDEIEYLTDHEG